MTKNKNTPLTQSIRDGIRSGVSRSVRSRRDMANKHGWVGLQFRVDEGFRTSIPGHPNRAFSAGETYEVYQLVPPEGYKVKQLNGGKDQEIDLVSLQLFTTEIGDTSRSTTRVTEAKPGDTYRVARDFESGSSAGGRYVFHAGEMLTVQRVSFDEVHVKTDSTTSVKDKIVTFRDLDQNTDMVESRSFGRPSNAARPDGTASLKLGAPPIIWDDITPPEFVPGDADLVIIDQASDHVVLQEIFSGKIVTVPIAAFYAHFTTRSDDSRGISNPRVGMFVQVNDSAPDFWRPSPPNVSLYDPMVYKITGTRREDWELCSVDKNGNIDTGSPQYFTTYELGRYFDVKRQDPLRSKSNPRELEMFRVVTGFESAHGKRPYTWQFNPGDEFFIEIITFDNASVKFLKKADGDPIIYGLTKIGKIRKNCVSLGMRDQSRSDETRVVAYPQPGTYFKVDRDFAGASYPGGVTKDTPLKRGEVWEVINATSPNVFLVAPHDAAWDAEECLIERTDFANATDVTAQVDATWQDPMDDIEFDFRSAPGTLYKAKEPFVSKRDGFTVALGDVMEVKTSHPDHFYMQDVDSKVGFVVSRDEVAQYMEQVQNSRSGGVLVGDSVQFTSNYAGKNLAGFHGTIISILDDDATVSIQHGARTETLPVAWLDANTQIVTRSVAATVRNDVTRSDDPQVGDTLRAKKSMNLPYFDPEKKNKGISPAFSAHEIRTGERFQVLKLDPITLPQEILVQRTSGEKLWIPWQTRFLDFEVVESRSVRAAWNTGDRFRVIKHFTLHNDTIDHFTGGEVYEVDTVNPDGSYGIHLVGSPMIVKTITDEWLDRACKKFTVTTRAAGSVDAVKTDLQRVFPSDAAFFNWDTQASAFSVDIISNTASQVARQRVSQIMRDYPDYEWDFEIVGDGRFRFSVTQH